MSAGQALNASWESTVLEFFPERHAGQYLAARVTAHQNFGFDGNGFDVLPRLHVRVSYEAKNNCPHS
jgi:hypothetical protein